MADAKISALTGATTPVAGTEILPIVQSGSTKKVSIDNLTKGRTVNASSFDTDVAAAGVTLSGTTLAADGTDANIDINLTPKGTGEVNIPKVDIDGGAIDGVTIGTNSVVTDLKVDNLRMDGSTLSGTATNGDMFVSPNGTGRLLLGNGDQADIVAGAFAAGGSANNNIDVLFWHRTPFLAYTGKLRSTLEYGAGGAEAGSMSLYLKSGGVDYRNMLWEPDGTITVDRGNLKIGTAGKGVVFTGNDNVLWRTGSGTPEGAITAPVGSLYTRTDGSANTTLYVKESGAGNTGWVAK